METRQAAGAYQEVAALFGHELSMPLATALLYIGIAENHCGLAPSGVRSALQVARREVQRLKMLVDTLTELERFGRPLLQPRVGDLGAIVRASVQRMVAPLLNPHVEVVIDASRPLMGHWDRPTVEQIIANLLSNALKFGQGQPIRIEARSADAGGVIISVSDRGVGVAPADRARIFERNTRAPARQGGGLGLGLWLVRELAVAHGGRVAVHSRKGRGATFIVWLRSQSPNSRVGTRYLMTHLATPRNTVRPSRAATPRLGGTGRLPATPRLGGTGRLPATPRLGAAGRSAATPRLGATAGRLPATPRLGATSRLAATPRLGAASRGAGVRLSS